MLGNVERNLADANQSERDLCGQLILISSAFLGLSGVFAASDWSDKLTGWEPGLLIAGVILLVLSVAAGIVYYFKVIKSETEWADIDNQTADAFDKASRTDSDTELYELTNAANELQKSKILATSLAWLKTEIILLATAAVVYIVLFILLIV